MSVDFAATVGPAVAALGRFAQRREPPGGQGPVYEINSTTSSGPRSKVS
jgi:hypothetical protein